MTNRIREILGWYASDNPGTRTNLAHLLNHGHLAGTGRMVILPVDQGFEHGPARSFAPNPPAYDPHYHFRLAIEAGCSAYAAPLGFLEAGAADFAGDIPLILKLNNHDSMYAETDPLGAQTGSVADALRLGCVAIGYTIYPGTAERRLLYEQARALIEEAKSVGLPTVLWSYARGGQLDAEAETALDTIAYAAQIAAQLGAHIIKVKLPSAHLADPKAAAMYDRHAIPRATLAERVRHVMDSSFAGRRIVLFSGGARNDDDSAVIAEAVAIRAGGGSGSIIGRNSFQRSHEAATLLLGRIMQVYADGTELPH
ncbi:MAG: class I fructose-bisphosphate aldolase [Gemmatimonadaceae bacterium]